MMRIAPLLLICLAASAGCAGHLPTAPTVIEGIDGQDGRDGQPLPEPQVSRVDLVATQHGDTWHLEAVPEGVGVDRIGSGAFRWRATDGHGQALGHHGSVRFMPSGRTAVLVVDAPSVRSRTVRVTVRVQNAGDSLLVGP